MYSWAERRQMQLQLTPVLQESPAPHFASQLIPFQNVVFKNGKIYYNRNVGNLKPTTEFKSGQCSNKISPVRSNEDCW